MITDAAEQAASCRPSTVTVGIAAFLSACFTTVRRVPVPTVNAVRT